MTYSVIANLCESRLFPSQHSLKREDFDSLSETAFLLLVALRICLAEEASEPWARLYAKRTIRSSNFKQWRGDATDIYVVLHALTHTEYGEEDGFPTVAAAPFILWLRFISRNDSETETRRFFTRLDQTLRIKNPSLRAIRRLVMDWPNLSRHEKKLATTRLLQFLRAYHPRAEILPFLVKVAKINGLEMKDVRNPEDEAKSDYVPIHPHEFPEEKKKGMGFLAGLAAFGAGAYAGYKATVKETTSSASVASVTSVLGAHPGIDPNGHKGIYEPSPMIRRGEAPKKKK